VTDRRIRWERQANDNVDRWGNQTAPTLFLAMVEEQGEVAEELLDQASLPDPDNDPDVAVEAWNFIGKAMELGHDVRDFLEGNFEGPAGKPDRGREQARQDIGGAHLDAPTDVQDEVDDLAPLVFQLTWEVQSQVDNPGIWVQDATGRWHRSTTFDGYDHGLACGLTMTTTDDVQNTQMNTDSVPADADRVCSPCWDHWRHGYDPTGDGDA
jgi:hypothetical protein